MKRTLLTIFITLLVGVGIVLVVDKPKPSSHTPAASQGSSPDSTDNSSIAEKTYTTSEVAQHNSAQSCWMIIENKVYDVTEFIALHPGGDEILRGCGIDATSLFEQRQTSSGEAVGSGTPHSPSAQSELQGYFIGNLATR